MKHFVLLVTFLIPVVFSFGCASGILYTHTVEPLAYARHPAPVVEAGKQGDIKHIQFQVVGAMWGDDALGDIARKNGMKEIYYADLERLAVLIIWRQYTVHIYGR